VSSQDDPSTPQMARTKVDTLDPTVAQDNVGSRARWSHLAERNGVGFIHRKERSGETKESIAQRIMTRSSRS